MRRTVLAAGLSLVVAALASALAGCAGRTSQSEAVTPIAAVRAMPKIDVHAHYSADNPGMVAALGDWNARVVLVNVASGDRPIAQKWHEYSALATAHPGRFFLVTTFDPFRFNESDFVPKAIEQLRADIAAGAKAVKVWKNIGMELKDAQGRYVQIDDPKFQPIWDSLAAWHVPVVAHIGEPLAAWRPLNPESPHYGYYSTNPQYHAYNHPEIPRHEDIIAARDRWVARNPKLTIVGFHMASLEYDVDEVAKRLDAYPNFYVETAARINDMAMQPTEKVRNFLIRYQDRVMWGTDFGEGTATRERLDQSFDEHWRYFSGADTVTLGDFGSWRRTVKGLALPRVVLEKLAHLNAERVLQLPPATAQTALEGR